MSLKIDVSTHSLAEFTQKAFNGKVTLEAVLAVWHEIGNIVKDQLLQRKPVRLTSFGIFSFNSRGDPVFAMAAEFGTQFKLKQRAQPTLGSVPASALNFSAIKLKTNIPRDIVEKIYSKFLTCLGRTVYEGRSILLTFHRVAEITIAAGELSSNFMPDFLAMFIAPPAVKKDASIRRIREAALNTSSNLVADQFFQQMDQSFPDQDTIIVDDPRTNPDRMTQTGLNIGRVETPIKRGKGRPQSASRGRNPITGSEHGGSNNGRPTSAPRPSSASNADSNRFDRLRQEKQTQQAQQQYQMQNDPRKLAAKALNVGDIINRVRAKIVERGGSNGIRSLSKLIAIMDDNGDKRLSRDELRYGLRDYGIDLTPTELEQVFLYFDRDGNGFIDVTEFLVGIKGDMNERRRKMVNMAFNILDKDNSGIITVDEILSTYDFTWHPEVRAGKQTIQEAARDFMKQWEKGSNSIQDGQVTPEEFEEYYKEISAGIDDDDYFELMIRNAWRIAGGEGAAANTANRRVLVTNADGSQRVETINNELGMKAKDMNDVKARLAKQGVNAASVALYGGYEDKQQPARPGARQPQFGTGTSRPQAPSQARGGGQAQRPRGGNGPPMDAWGVPPGPGDQDLPPEFPPPQQIKNARNGQQQLVDNDNDPYSILRRLLYSPPAPLETLCQRLQVAASSNVPRIAKGAFLKRLSTLDASLSKEQLAGMWQCVDPRNTGTAEVPAIHQLLCDRFGKDNKTAAKQSNIIDTVKLKILERCGQTGGIKGLARMLAIFDDSGDKKLTKDELKNGLADYGLALNIRELDEVFSYFDRDKSGTIDIDELLVGIRGDLNPRRQKMIDMVFNILDADGSGIITVDEMLERYDFTAHPEVIAGKKTKQQAMREFMRTWDRGDQDGEVTKDEFNDYYKEISASIDGDDYFELMIRNAWRIAGGEGAAANTANRRVLVTNADGSQCIETINNELGMKAKDMNDVKARLAKQGVNAASVAMYGGYEDKPDGGNRPMNPAMAQRLQQQSRPSNAGGGGRAQVNMNRTAGPATTNYNNGNSNTISGSNNNRSRAMMNQTAPPAPLFERHAAAAKLAAAFRGKVGRKIAESERRKNDALQQQLLEDEREANRPKPAQVIRPKGRSYVGF